MLLYSKHYFMKTLTIDMKKCVGCGTCCIIAPKTFKMGKNGKAMVISNGKDKNIDLAIFTCPVQAISRSIK